MVIMVLCLIWQIEHFISSPLRRNGYFESINLRKWYETYRLSAVIADVLILVIGIVLTRYLYYKVFNTYSILKFLGLLLVIQLIHDILFYYLFKSIPRGVNKMLDLFKDYSKEVGYKAILGDSFMILLSGLLGMCLSKMNKNENIIVLIVVTYLIPYIIHTK